MLTTQISYRRHTCGLALFVFLLFFRPFLTSVKMPADLVSDDGYGRQVTTNCDANKISQAHVHPIVRLVHFVSARERKRKRRDLRQLTRRTQFTNERGKEKRRSTVFKQPVGVLYSRFRLVGKARSKSRLDARTFRSGRRARL